MINKYSKVLLIAICAFFTSLMSTNAKELTIDGLANAVKEIQPNATYVYVIGEYAFTSEHVLTTQDTMLAARSIKVSDNSGATNDDQIYNEMTIAYFEGVYDSDWNLTGLKYVKNVVGSEPAKTTYDIKYIDYNKLYGKVDVDALVKDAYDTIKGQASTDKFEISMDGTDIGIILKDLDMNSVNALAGTGIATAAIDFLNEEGVAGVTLALDGETITIEGTTIDQAEVDAFFKKLGTKAGDLVGKTMTATVLFKDGYKTANSTGFTINFGKQVDVDTLVKTAYETVKGQVSADKFVVSLAGTNIKVTMMDLEMNSIDALAGTGVATAAPNFLKEQGIAGVTLSLDGETLTIEGTTVNPAEVEAFLKKIGSKAGDLVGKTINVTVNFKEGFETANSDEFTISLEDASKVDVDALVKDAYDTIKGQASTDKFEISMDGTDIGIILKDLDMNSVNALAGTGVATAAIDFLNEEGIAGVTLSLDGETITIEGITVDQAEVDAFFKKLGTKAGDLVGKTMTATVLFEDGYKTANSTGFTINFGKQVDVDTLVKTAYETVKGQVSADKFVVSLAGTNIKVTMMDLEMNSIDALAGTGVATAATNFLKEQGIAGVTLSLDGETLTIEGTTVNPAEVEAFLKKIGSKAGDLVGKTINVTVKFKEGFETANSDKFTISLEDASKVDVDALVKDAYDTIKGQASTDKFEISMDGTNIGIILKDLEMNSVNALAGTGVATAAIDFLNEEGVAGVTLSLDGETITIEGTTVDQAAIDAFFKKLGTKASDLVGKTMTATVLFKDGYKTANSDSFVIEFDQMKKVDVNNLVNKAHDIIKGQAAKDKFITKLDGSNIDIILVNLNMSSIDALAGTGVATAATNFLNEEGIESVTLVYGNEQLVVSADSINANDVEKFLKNLGNKASDLVDKNITAKLAFKTGYETANLDEFMINFSEEEKVDVNNLVNKAHDIIKGQAAKDKFITKLDGSNIEIMLVDLNMSSIDALAGTGVATAATNFLKEQGIAGVTLSLDGEILTIEGTTVNPAEVEAFLKKFGSKAGDLVGKTITAKINFAEGYKTANLDKFTIKITEEEKVDVQSLVADAYEIISSKQNDVFEANINGENIEIILKDLNANSVNTLAGSGIGKAAFHILEQEGIAGACLEYEQTSKCFSKDNLNAQDVQEFFEELGTTTRDLIGKNISINILFEEGYKALDKSVFNVTFAKKIYNVNFDVDGAVRTENVAVEDTVNVPTTPTKAGYTFDKWLLNGSEYDFSTPITNDITLTASWTINKYNITIVANDSTMGRVSKSELIAEYGAEISVLDNSITIGDETVIATPTDKTAQYTYSFTNWTNASTPIQNNMTITANFSKSLNKYTVTYVDSSNQTLGTQTVDYGTKVRELSAPHQEGKVITDYVKDATVIDGNYEITDNTTLKLEYANEFDIDQTLSDSLDAINARYYTAKLVDDVITANFTDPNLTFTNFTFMGEVLDLLESLTSNPAYQSVKLSYDNDPSHTVEIKGNVDVMNVARFIGLVTEGTWSGSLGRKADVNKLVTATAKKPITVTVTLVDGYADPTGNSVVYYDLVFTCTQ